MSNRIQLNAGAIKALALIILTAVVGIILLSGLGLMLRFGLFGAEQAGDANTVADEALSILGNVASAAVGGLVGWLTRDYVESKPEPVPGPLYVEPEEQALVEDFEVISPGDNED